MLQNKIQSYNCEFKKVKHVFVTRKNNFYYFCFLPHNTFLNLEVTILKIF